MHPWQDEVRKSGMIHTPLPLHTERSLEAEAAQKPIEASRHIGGDRDSWAAYGECSLSWEEESTFGLRIDMPLALDRRPAGQLEDGDCGTYGSAGARLSVNRENWEDFNRIAFRIHSKCAGMRKVHIRLCFENDGVQKIPDRYLRDGFHTINLSSDGCDDCYLEIPSLPRDAITALRVEAGLSGCEQDMRVQNHLTLELKDLRLERIALPEPSIGWRLADGEIALCYSGYLPGLAKTAVCATSRGASFSLRNEGGDVVFTGTATPCDGFDSLSLLDFSAFDAPGTYHLCIDGGQSESFPIAGDAWAPSLWKTINFLFCERCGYPVPGVHCSCHRDVMAHHGGQSFVFNGGWHDAGDLSQQLIQSAEVTFALFEMAQSIRGHDEALYLRLLEEAQWGLDYVLKSRFGDGFRATSVGTALWSRGFVGDADDIRARVHNSAYENFLCAGVEAFAAGVLLDVDLGLSRYALACAEADYAFAMERFAQRGFDELPPSYWEHSHMTAPSTKMATASWAASLLYQQTQKTEYAQQAAEHAAYMLSCQQHAPAGKGFAGGGFFWRDTERKAIVHFSHQAREHVFAQALVALLETQPEHVHAPQWHEALRRYADYLHGLMRYASPYGMFPAGLYRLSERDDRESFALQHLETGPEAYDAYARQLEAGIDVGDGYHLRQFPVWFSFRGNNAVILSLGKAASLCALMLGDKALLSAAVAQLEWNIGKNPFRQSLMYGEGQRYAQQYAAMMGEATGELPVGIQTLEDGDIPYWPQMNNATYKEVWTTPAGRWLSILADVYRAKDHPVQSMKEGQI